MIRKMDEMKQGVADGHVYYETFTLAPAAKKVCIPLVLEWSEYNQSSTAETKSYEN